MPTVSEAGSQAEVHEAVIQRQHAMASAGDDNRLPYDAEYRRMRFSQTHGLVCHAFRSTPFLDGRRVDRVATRQIPDALFTPLYRTHLSDAGHRLPRNEWIAFVVVALPYKTCPMLSQSLRCHV